MPRSVQSSRLDHKTVLITGASSGIGHSTAVEFARWATSHSCTDVRIVLAARRQDKLDALVKCIQSDPETSNVTLFPICFDITSAADRSNLLASLPVDSASGRRWCEIDILINNAGLVLGVACAPYIQESDIEIMFNTNVLGLIALTQHVLVGMKERGRGDIINIGSIAGRDPYEGGSIYCATKAALSSWTNALRRELVGAGSRIRVIEIAPGQVETEFSLVRYGGDKALADAVYAGQEPLMPDDIAEIIVFAATRRENVVMADNLVFPNHQAAAKALFKRDSSNAAS